MMKTKHLLACMLTLLACACCKQGNTEFRPKEIWPDTEGPNETMK